MAKGNRLLSLGPALFSNAYALYLVFFQKAGVSDLLFWFWLDFVVSFLFLVPLAESYRRNRRREVPAEGGRFLLIFGFLLALFYLTLFLGITYKAEWGAGRLPEFILGKTWGIILFTVISATRFLAEYNGRRYLYGSYDDLTGAYGSKGLVICAMYLVLQVQYHWFTGRLQGGGELGFIVLAFIIPKMLVEAGASPLWLRDRLREMFGKKK